MGVGKPSERHPSHNHPLRIFKSREGDDNITCSGCELAILGEAFKCRKSECDYFLHKSCFDLPCEINHKSHPEHPLILHYSPPYGHSSYTCNACGKDGSGFAYHCLECQYDVHVGCASISETVKRDDHEHPLTLLYCTPCKGNEDGMVFTCDVCEDDVVEDLWVYYCKECDYGTHVHSCAKCEDNEPKKGGEASSSASRMKSEMVAMQAVLDALDNAGSYVGSSWETKMRYYY